MTRLAIIGATGYTGLELIRLLRAHPRVTTITLASRQEALKPVPTFLLKNAPSIHPTYYSPDDKALDNHDVIFFATPNGTALKGAKRFIEAGCKVIDLSADYRLKNADTYAKWYGELHTEPSLLQEAVYGLPEFNRAAIAKARIVANPGCYATAIQLALAPLLADGVIHANDIIANAASGASGAGKKVTEEYIYTEVNENFRAYALAGHRHHPEIVQGLMSEMAKRVRSSPSIDLIFTPHLLPMQRGILATIYVKQAVQDHGTAIAKAYANHYTDSAFIEVLPMGLLPDTGSVAHTNLCRMGYQCHNGTRTTIISCIDNMMKGAAGQAVQNMNIMLGFPETLSLL